MKDIILLYINQFLDYVGGLLMCVSIYLIYTHFFLLRKWKK